MIGSCLIAPDIFRAVRENARARRARGAISELGGHFARKDGDMSADADDLLERVARAEERDVPTLDELKAGLEQALDELERNFPDGPPSRGRSGMDRLSYGTLMMRITNYRWKLEDGDYTEIPRDVLQVEQSAPTMAWEMFLEDHPELAPSPQTFTDDEILKALRAAIESRSQPWLQGAASSGCVVTVLLPAVDTRAMSQTSLTGKQLARLAREGRVVRLRRKWTNGRGSSIWSLPGIEVNEWWLKQYEVENAS